MCIVNFLPDLGYNSSKTRYDLSNIIDYLRKSNFVKVLDVKRKSLSMIGSSFKIKKYISFIKTKLNLNCRYVFYFYMDSVKFMTILKRKFLFFNVHLNYLTGGIYCGYVDKVNLFMQFCVWFLNNYSRSKVLLYCIRYNTNICSVNSIDR